MGLFDAIRGQFIDVIEWLDDTHDTLAFRFERAGNEIKNGARLIVRPGQTAIFVSEGKLADVFTEGTYTLETQNLPVLSTLQAWKHGFNSPFKAEVYFFSTRQFPGLKWGTPAPITVRDPELGPVRLRAFGTYTLRVADATTLLRQLVSTNPSFETRQVAEPLRALMVRSFSAWVSKSGLSMYDFASQYPEIGEVLRAGVASDFAAYGLELVQVNIENIGLPAEVEAALDKRTQMNVLGDMDRYLQFQAANALEAGAKKPGGANPALELAVGVALGNQLSKKLDPK